MTLARPATAAALAATALTAALTLTACGAEEIHSVEKTYEITAIDPPKRFYVSVRDVETGEVSEKIYVSKRCSSWQKLEIGSQWTFQEKTYRKDDGTTFTGVSVSGLCDRLAKGETGKPKA